MYKRATYKLTSEFTLVFYEPWSEWGSMIQTHSNNLSIDYGEYRYDFQLAARIDFQFLGLAKDLELNREEYSYIETIKDYKQQLNHLLYNVIKLKRNKEYVVIKYSM